MDTAERNVQLIESVGCERQKGGRERERERESRKKRRVCGCDVKREEGKVQ